MTYRIIHFGTGRTGKHALRSILTHPQMELVGLLVHSAANEGRDAGEFVGLPATGVKGTRSFDAILATDADCVCFMAADPLLEDPRIPGSYTSKLVDQMCRILESGKNVAATAVATLVYADIWAPEVLAKVEAACKKGKSSFINTGIDPGFMADDLLLNLTSLSANIKSVHLQEILNLGNYEAPPDANMDGPSWFDEHNGLMTEQMVEAFLACDVHQIARGLDVKLDAVVPRVEVCRSEKAFQTPLGMAPAGTIAALRFMVAGVVGGGERIILEHIWRLYEGIAPHWGSLGPNRGGYRVVIDGTPPMHVEIALGDAKMDNITATCAATGARIVNAIPIVCDADPGVLNMFNRPMIMGRGMMR